VAQQSTYLHRYTLKSRTSLNAATSSQEFEGALLRIDTPTGSGFANIHPWPTLGDPSLDQCLQKIDATPLGQQALHCANLDRKARSANRSLFEALTPPTSHRTLPSFDHQIIEESLSLGFNTVKVKVGHNWKNENQRLLQLFQDFPKLNWRLDFNHLATATDILSFRKAFSNHQEHKIDFIEDPFPITQADWAHFQKQNDLPFASDNPTNAKEAQHAQWRIIKPAKQDSEQELKKAAEHQQLTIITSYMDHPLGQSYAAYQATQNKILEDCGLVTHQLFEPNEFTEILGPESPQFTPSKGTGLGFDELLESLPWKKLS